MLQKGAGARSPPANGFTEAGGDDSTVLHQRRGLVHGDARVELAPPTGIVIDPGRRRAEGIPGLPAVVGGHEKDVGVVGGGVGGVPYGVKPIVEIGLIQTHGNLAPTPTPGAGDYVGNVAAIQIGGFGGNVKIYRR